MAPSKARLQARRFEYPVVYLDSYSLQCVVQKDNGPRAMKPAGRVGLSSASQGGAPQSWIKPDCYGGRERKGITEPGQTMVLRRRGNSGWPRRTAISPQDVEDDVQGIREGRMKAEKEIVTLLREIRDFVQILVVREQLHPLAQEPSVQRNSRSWILWGHRTHPRKRTQADDTTPTS
jgi:hypothetical protein